MLAALTACSSGDNASSWPQRDDSSETSHDHAENGAESGAESGEEVSGPPSGTVDENAVPPLGGGPQSATPELEVGLEDEVRTAAETMLTTWARPDMSYDAWWAELAPLMNAQGQQDYAYTDPSVVPALKVNGTDEVEVATGATTALAWVPTTQGRFGVLMNRTSPGEAWLAARIYFPGTDPGFSLTNPTNSTSGDSTG